MEQDAGSGYCDARRESNLNTCVARSFLTCPLADTFHPPYPPIASQSISRDVPVARVRAVQFSIPLLKGVAEAALYCAHRAMHYNIAPSKLARYLFRDGG